MFYDFNGCAAVQCESCPCNFCGLCLKDCGSNAHGHVSECSKNPTTSVFVDQREIQNVHRQMKQERLRMHLQTIKKPKIRRAVFAGIRKDLMQLEINPNDFSTLINIVGEESESDDDQDVSANERNGIQNENPIPRRVGLHRQHQLPQRNPREMVVDLNGEQVNILHQLEIERDIELEREMIRRRVIPNDQERQREILRQREIFRQREFREIELRRQRADILRQRENRFVPLRAQQNNQHRQEAGRPRNNGCQIL